MKFQFWKSSVRKDVVLDKDVGLKEFDGQQIKENVKEDSVGIEKEETVETISTLQLFRYTSKLDKMYIVLAILASIVNGLSSPLLFLTFSDVINLFTQYYVDIQTSQELAVTKLRRDIDWLCIQFTIIGLVTMVAGFLQLYLWMLVGERQSRRLRENYYKTTLAQTSSWYDLNGSKLNVISQLSTDLNLIQESVSERLGQLIQNLTTFLAGFLISYFNSWKLSLVLTSVVPVVAFCESLFGKMVVKQAEHGSEAYGSANGIAQEVLTNLRTVLTFNNQPLEKKRYRGELKAACRQGLRKSAMAGLSMGTILMVVFLSYALAMWYGGQLIKWKEVDPKNVLTVFFSVVIGATALGQCAPSWIGLATAKGAAAKLFKVLNSTSTIDPFLISNEMQMNQSKLKEVKGRIEFDKVRFSYPKRPELETIKGLNLIVEAGSTVALVGSSGSGKSTLISLIERFYDPTSGAIRLDGIDIRSVSPAFLRKQIGLVNQEPILFDTTIKANVLLGLDRNLQAELSADELQAKVEEACKLSNVHQFIMSLANQYETQVGSRGTQLSGGQKQRIAIARAIIKDPKILLLDEATSALDSQSERIVQQALQNLSKHRTTIVVAHRLSTVKNADTIVVFDQGTIVEQGSHETLMQLQGTYFILVNAQELRTGDNTDDLNLGSEEFNKVLEDEKKHFQVVDSELKKHHSTGQEVSEQCDKSPTDKQPLPLIRILGLVKRFWYLLLLGTLGALLEGVTMPLYSLVLTNSTQAFIELASGDVSKGEASINFWSLIFVALAGSTFVSCSLRLGCFSALGDLLTLKVRGLLFTRLIDLDLEYFDRPNTSSHKLLAKLASEPDLMATFLTRVLGGLFIALSCATVGLALAFTSGWKLTLVALACLPLTAISQLIGIQAMTKLNLRTQSEYHEVVEQVTESITHIRTVHSLAREYTFYQNFQTKVESAHRLAKSGFLQAGLTYGFASGAPFLVNALTFYYGSVLFLKGEYTYLQMFQTITAIMYTGTCTGFVASELSSYVKSKVAANRIFALLDTPYRFSDKRTEGFTGLPIKGNFNLRQVEFHYPSRPQSKVLQSLDFDVLQDKKVALVGSSGSGKSTIFLLLQRFYEITGGNIQVEGLPLEEWNVHHLRHSISTVSQEPALFDITLRDNIRYGAFNDAHLTDDQVIQVAKLANAHDFIMELPHQYDTHVGKQGSQLSGGQKQRIAIARALISNPKVLFLDEATSALDSHSELLVQQALDRAANSRTTITIAHRLSTIQDYDIIVVLDQGTVVELGTHDQLLQNRSTYFHLVNQQNFKLVE